MTGSFIEVYLSITKPFKCNKRESMSVYENDKPRIIMQNNTLPIATQNQNNQYNLLGLKFDFIIMNDRNQDTYHVIQYEKFVLIQFL